MKGVVRLGGCGRVGQTTIERNQRKKEGGLTPSIILIDRLLAYWGSAEIIMLSGSLAEEMVRVVCSCVLCVCRLVV